MFFYFIPPLIALIGSILNNRLSFRAHKTLFFLIGLSSIAIYAGVYMNGTDWPAYEHFYDILEWSNLLLMAKVFGFELGFSSLVMMIKTLGIGFWPMLILFKSFSIIVLLLFIKKQCWGKFEPQHANVYLIIFAFLLGSAMYMYVETIIRFSLACAIVMLGYKYYFNRNLFRYMLVVVIAIMFHRSAVIMIPIYFITNISSKRWMIMLFLGIVLTLSTPYIIFEISKLLSLVFPDSINLRIEGYVNRAIADGYNKFAIGNIVKYISLGLIVWNKEHFTQIKNGEKIYALSVIYGFLFVISIAVSALNRATLFLFPIFIVALFHSLTRSSVTKLIVKPMYIAYFIAATYMSINEKASFLPYTNYFSHAVKGDFPSFEERLSFAEKEDVYKKPGGLQ